ncbi:hypothetical protein [Selenomonas sp. ND2010]|jgi:hypothetical protein|uniref:hypothetical protein n=1 Tax=Selenomonas sp. ND2010 TaxID=1410618 RepID=UPI00051C90B8|nr:hypothetical protein [Selenomonas sp. ND2010]
MKNLEWCELANKFYAFKSVADQLGFYVPELQGMEHSLELCRPFAFDAAVENKVRNLSETQLPKIDFSKLAVAHPPIYDENDELAQA